jgi:hypothetical protein
MRCLEVRQQLFVSPEIGTADLKSHLEQCASCKAFQTQMLMQERLIKQAIEVPVPTHLSERILLANNLAPSSKRPWFIGGGIAASFLAMTLFFNGLVGQDQADPSWGEVAIMHVLNEQKALTANGNISKHVFNEALKQFGLAETGHIGRVRYLEHCEMPGGQGLHVVVEHESLGVFTLVLPPEGVYARSPKAQRKGLVAQFVSIGKGSVGLVSAQSSQMPSIKRLVEDQLTPISIF